MPIELKKKSVAQSTPRRVPVEEALLRPKEALESGFNPSNRATRTPIGWILDPSPSMDGFTKVQLDCAVKMVEDLRTHHATGRSILMNMVQIGTPPNATGFSEIEQFKVPELQVASSTPLHLALGKMTNDLGRLFADLRQSGVERTDSVVVITTDGGANDCSAEELAQSIKQFLDLGKRWSVTNLVVGVGSRLNEDCLKALVNSIPPLKIEELDAAVLTPFIQRIAVSVSQSRRGQKIVMDIPEEMKVIE